jgi:phytoene dehydrogenase-like protein
VKYDAIVIGAGLNGLVAATTLARAGRRVLVAERAGAAGGKRRKIEFAPGYRAAPFAIDPGWLPPFVARAAGFGAIAPEFPAAPLTLALARGEFLTLSADPARAAEAIARHSRKDSAAWSAFAAQLRTLAAFLERAYSRPVPRLDTKSPREIASLAGLALAFRRLGRADITALLRTLPMSVQDFLDDRFASDPLKAALAAGGIAHIRQGPRSGGTAFVLLHRLVGAPAGAVRRAGHWSDGGLVAALEESARGHRVTIRTDAEIKRILVRDDAVTGVVLEGGEEIAAALVISSADPARTVKLVDPVWLDPEFLHAAGNIKYRGATAFVLYALDGTPEIPGLTAAADALGGVVTLTPTLDGLERAYDAAKYGRVSERPLVEISLPTLTAPRDAPAGKHVLVARAQFAPYRLREGEWDEVRRDALADAVTETIETISTGFAARVRHRAVLAPPDLEAEYGITEGAADAGEMMLDQILYMRPLPGWAHYRMPVDGLYLCGAGTHPGGGVIGASGLFAARAALHGR